MSNASSTQLTRVSFRGPHDELRPSDDIGGVIYPSKNIDGGKIYYLYICLRLMRTLQFEQVGIAITLALEGKRVRPLGRY